MHQSYGQPSPQPPPLGQSAPIECSYPADAGTALRLSRAAELARWRSPKTWASLAAFPLIVVVPRIIQTITRSSLSNPGLSGIIGSYFAVFAFALIVGALVTAVRLMRPNPQVTEYAAAGIRMRVRYDLHSMEVALATGTTTVIYHQIEDLAVIGGAVFIRPRTGSGFALPRELVPAPALALIRDGRRPGRGPTGNPEVGGTHGAPPTPNPFAGPHPHDNSFESANQVPEGKVSFVPRERGGWQRQFRAWLWPATAVVITSVVGAGALIGLRSADRVDTDGYLGTTPDTRGYGVVDNLCATLDFAAMASAGFKAQDNGPKASAYTVNRHPALDTADCLQEFVKAENQARGRLTISVYVHKQSNPIPAFRAGLETAGQQPALGGSTPEIEEVAGLGDIAYLVYEAKGLKTTLRVRDGWFVYDASWQAWGTAGPGGLSRNDQRKVLTDIATEALPRLRQ
ncbi:hypothetical protein [Nocardia sp. NPDC127526]|uniref:hypothetical protein n=1 Tax=Nocardia sp. NPDC127526 TaxID=3345393 RepID=UPI003625C77F